MPSLAHTAPCLPLVCRETAGLCHSCYDLGHLIGTLLHCALAARGLGEAGDRTAARPAQEAWLLESLSEAWEAYWAERRVCGPPAGLASSPADEHALLADTLGWAAVVLLRWSIGAAGGSRGQQRWLLASRLAAGLKRSSFPLAQPQGAYNIQEVMGLAPGTPAHTAAVRRAVHLGSALVRYRRRIPSMAAVADMLRAALDDGSVEAAAALVPKEQETPLPAAALPSRAQMLGRSRSCRLSNRDLASLSRVLMRQHTSERALRVVPES